MNSQGSYAGDIGSLHGAPHGILEQARPDATALPTHLDGKAGQQHERQWVSRQAFAQPLGRFFTSHLADDQRVKTDDDIVSETDIGLCRVGLLVGPCTGRTHQDMACQCSGRGRCRRLCASP